MASQETEFNASKDQKHDQKNVVVVDTNPAKRGKPNADQDDNSFESISAESNQISDGTVHALSGLYAQIIVVVAAILVFTELLHGPVPLFFFHGYLFTFLVGGGILCFLVAYVNMMFNKCPRWSKNSFDGKRKSVFSAQFVRSLLYSDISIYLRIGSVVFGLATLISSGLEVTAIFTMPSGCIDELNMLQPLLRGLFSFMQMHFLFMNSKEMVNSFRWLRHIALMHLVATNLAIWLQIMMWESAKDWLDAVHHKHNSSIEWNDAKFNLSIHSLDSDIKHQDEERHKTHHRVHIAFSRQCLWNSYIESNETEGLMAYHICIQNSTIGDIWEKAMPYLYPFIVQYCLVATAVIYTTWSNLQVQRLKIQRITAASVYGREQTSDDVNCDGSTRGLFLGFLILVVGIIAIILFFVLAQDKNFNVHFMIGALECGIFALSTLVTIIGIVQIRKMKSKTSRQRRLSEFLQRIGMLAVYIYGICNMIVGGVSITGIEHFILFVDGTLMVVQACLQSLFIHQVSKKRCSPVNVDEKPGRQVVIFLVFSNIVLWILETFTTQKQLRSQLQLKFYGEIAWPVITRIVLPFVIFYRFHSAVALMEAWRKSYRVKQN